MPLPFSKPPVSDPNARIVSVEIQGMRYPIRSALDAAYIARLASYVDGKMRAASDESPTGDSMKLAVVAALNIADEYFRSREFEESLADEFERRTEDLERLLDRALELAAGSARD
jgi:cell division protein ZapA